jgi:hypothetical protein
MEPGIISPWRSDWVWALPLIAATVMLHAFGLAFINRPVSRLLAIKAKSRAHTMPILVIGGAASWATILHGFEASIWAAAYLLLGAMTDRKAAMLYSLNAMTAYGHADLHLEKHWELMGSLEALNGWILFGITAAFLFTVIQRGWPNPT